MGPAYILSQQLLLARSGCIEPKVCQGKAVDLDLFFPLENNYFTLGMFRYLNETSLHAESEDAIIVLIQGRTNISVFGNRRVKKEMRAFPEGSYVLRYRWPTYTYSSLPRHH